MKQVQQTKKVKDLIAKSVGNDAIDFEKLAVFEAVAINNLPLSKNGVYNGAIITPNTIKEMESALNKENFVPLHINHRQGSELPSGRTFFGKTTKRAGKSGKEITDLHVLFYISNGTPSGSALIDGIDTGTINEVSVGMYPKTVKCSKCEFDYIKDGSFMNWLDASCTNGHKIGEKGVHAVLDGLSRFMEISLVSLGAADHARIKSGDTSIIASLEDDDAEDYKLAAVDSKESLSLLVATKGTEINMNKLNAGEVTELREDFTKRGQKAIEAKHAGITALLAKVGDDITIDEAKTLREEFSAELAKFVADEPKVVDPAPAKITLSLEDLVNAKSAQKIAETNVVNLTTINEDLKTQLTAAKTEVTELTAKQATFDALSNDNKTMIEFLKLSCQQLLIASGINNGTVPESVADILSTIKTAQAKLTKLPVGGLGLTPEMMNASIASAKSKTSSAFRTKKD